jgi:hypothetical protein
MALNIEMNMRFQQEVANAGSQLKVQGQPSPWRRPKSA